MKQILLLASAFLLAASLWAHEGHHPAETDFASDICAQCQMAVTSPKYAAQITLEDKALFFDDIGCLVQYEKQGKAQGLEIHARYVRRAGGEGWVAVEKAFWITTKEVRTPMGYGYHAFADQKAADAFVQAHPGARPITWADLVKAVPEKSMMKM